MRPSDIAFTLAAAGGSVFRNVAGETQRSWRRGKLLLVFKTLAFNRDGLRMQGRVRLRVL
jgi:hypothetical protein